MSIRLSTEDTANLVSLICKKFSSSCEGANAWNGMGLLHMLNSVENKLIGYEKRIVKMTDIYDEINEIDRCSDNVLGYLDLIQEKVKSAQLCIHELRIALAKTKEHAKQLEIENKN